MTNSASAQDSQQWLMPFDNSRPTYSSTGIGAPKLVRFRCLKRKGYQGIPQQNRFKPVAVIQLLDNWDVSARLFNSKSYPLDYLAHVLIRDQITP